MQEFSAQSRNKAIAKLQSEKFDIIIIGGGITGAGILLDAQLRGLNCCLLEMQDFSEGTSSRSTKLIHGGLRYLKQFNFKLVRETGRERTIVANTARHITKPKKVVIPVTKSGSFSRLTLKLALIVYDILAKVPEKLKHKRLSRKDLMEMIPIINESELRGGMVYTEYQTNDARLTLELIKSGVENNGLALNRFKALDLIINPKGQTIGIKSLDLLTDIEHDIFGTCIINAAGPWADKVFDLGKNDFKGKLIPTMGIHLVFHQERFPLDKAVYFNADDKRLIFAIPNENSVYVGTTDTFFDGDLAQPIIEASDVLYLINSCNKMFSRINLTSSDIVGAWAGLRPLLFQKNKKPSEISRKYEIFESSNGVLTIAGGKLTGYRKMAEKTVDSAIAKHFSSIELKICTTDTYKLNGSHYTSSDHYLESKVSFIENATKAGWAHGDAKWVYHHFGSQSHQILHLEIEENMGFPEYLHKTLIYALQFEMVISPLDFIVRRTNLFHFHPKIVELHYSRISEIIYEFVGLTTEQRHFEERRSNDLNGEMNRIQKGL